MTASAPNTAERETEEIIRLARAEIYRLCVGHDGKTLDGVPGRRWTMCIPIREDDSDRIFARLADECESLRTERDRLQRIVDLVSAPGSIVKPSGLNPGYVCVTDGRTGLDACERSAARAFDVLFEEADGGESPGRMYIAVTPEPR